MHQERAEQKAAVAVLDMLHVAKSRETFETPYPAPMSAYAGDPLRCVAEEEGGATRRVLATTDIPTGSMTLAPCVPKTGKVYKESNDPKRAKIIVQTLPFGAPQIYYVQSEWQCPLVEDELGPADERCWKWTGLESMHLFWCVRRLTAEQLKKEPQLRLGHNARFNVALVDHGFNNVAVGRFRSESVSQTIKVTVELMENTADIQAGEELIMEIAPTKKLNPDKKERGWKEDVIRDERAAKAAKRSDSKKEKKVGPEIIEI
jgi:hypothetical protein